MIRIPGRIPITIYPTFWLFAALIGFLNSGSLAGILIWLIVIFISVLFHEFGHALTALAFGRNPRIELVALGGLTYHDGDKLRFWKQFLIVLDGPLFGFLLFFIAFLLNTTLSTPGLFKSVVQLTEIVNFFWTALNLLPILPLDGGQLLRIVCEKIFGVRGFHYSLLCSLIVALGISLVSFLYQRFLVGALFFLLAFQSYDTWKRTRRLAEPDRKESLKAALEDAEKDLSAGRKTEALDKLMKIRADAKEGMIYLLATQYSAFLKYEMGQHKEVYDLLLSLRAELPPDALYLLQRVAFDVGDFSLVIALSGECYQAFPSAEAALRNAFASARLAQSEAAIGWLETALKDGLQDLAQILGHPSFDPIRTDPLFRAFAASHQ